MDACCRNIQFGWTTGGDQRTEREIRRGGGECRDLSAVAAGRRRLAGILEISGPVYSVRQILRLLIAGESKNIPKIL